VDDPVLSGRPATAPRLHVVFVVRAFGFPHGMAAAHRLRLLGRALTEQGADARVLCTRVSERPGHARNRDVSGVCDGLPYLYSPGTTTRSTSFAARRYHDARGLTTALAELTRLRRAGQLDCVYLADTPEGFRPDMWLLARRLRALGVPVVLELNEFPARMGMTPGAPPRPFSCLDAVSGASVISSWLATWVRQEAARIGRPVHVLELPIVVDPAEQPEAAPYPNGRPTVVYAASDGYDRVIAFLLQAMERVWAARPDCTLTITGMRPERVARLGAAAGRHAALDAGRVALTGYLPRERLFEQYRDARALLIPLYDDDRSRARFPTKIGEYLLSARPLVAGGVGEVKRYLRDRETAYLATPGDPAAFAAKVLEVLADEALAARVGLAGRRLAEKQLDYAVQGARLHAFLEELAGVGAGARLL
jgi:glycosyltransferase involved in cell wall biosynthesis